MKIFLKICLLSLILCGCLGTSSCAWLKNLFGNETIVHAYTNENISEKLKEQNGTLCVEIFNSVTGEKKRICGHVQ